MSAADGTTPKRAQHYWNKGWTADLVYQVHGLATWAVQHRTGVTGRPNPLGNDQEEADLVYQRLTMALYYLPEDYRALTNQTALPWVALLAACPTPAEADTLDLYFGADEPADLEQFAPWVNAGPLGPLGYAAGLTATETARRNSVDPSTVQAEATALEMLAVLRGWTLPLLLIGG